MTSTQLASCYLSTKVGWLRIEADDDGLTAIEFVKQPKISSDGIVDNPHLKDAYKQLSEYFRGERSEFSLRLNPKGTDFQKAVWKGLTTIPFGTTASYKDLAILVGRPGGARAVGMANNKNPLPIVVPCHRVIGANGDLVGYAPGVDLKRQLLTMEGASFA